MIASIADLFFHSQWTVGVGCGLLMFGSAELGFRLGLRLFRVGDAARKDLISAIQGAILGLLALLLGFTFAMAIARYDTRRDLVLKEANAIGTTGLRGSLLPEAQQPVVRQLLRQYVEARIDFYHAGEDRAAIANAEKSAADLQDRLWKQAVEAVKVMPPALTGLYLTPLNEMIDLSAERTHALRTRVPGVVWFLLLFVAGCGCCISGYAAGACGARSGFSMVLLPVLLAVVITVVVDIDRPRKGLIGIDQRPLLELRQSMQAGTP